jgi:nucleoside-diphosphate-sugar epimerase
MEGDKKVVTITGISGYLGSQTCYQFLKLGTMKVRGTVRSTKNEARLQPLKEAFGDMYKDLELIEADLNDEASMIAACEGSNYVIHTASPFIFGKVKDVKKDLLDPAINGTTCVMKGCHKFKVEKVVITSSTVAMIYKNDPKTCSFGPESWSDEKACDPYALSKMLAEKAAWDF